MATYTFVKKSGAPAGTIRFNVGGNSLLIDDASNTTIVTTDENVASALRNSPVLDLQGSSGTYTPPPTVQDLFLADGVASTNRFSPTDAYIKKANFGNATSTEYAGEANMPIQGVVYFGNAGGQPVSGRPQAYRWQAKFFAPTTADSAQGGSTQSVLVASASPLTQTLPLTGDESDVIVQDNWDVTAGAGAVAHSFAAEAQGTGRIRKARAVYVAAKAAKDAGSIVDEWVGVYIEDPTTGSAGTITEKAGLYSKLRLQTESSVIIGSTMAAITTLMRNTTLHVVGQNASGSPAVKIVKKSGSTDDIFQVADSAANPFFILGQAGQVALKPSGTTHSFGSGIGPVVYLGPVSTAPTGTFVGFYNLAGALMWRGSSGTVTQVAPA